MPAGASLKAECLFTRVVSEYSSVCQIIDAIDYLTDVARRKKLCQKHV